MAETRCPSCGYTKKDAQINGDHRLCKNAGNAHWEKRAETRQQKEFKKLVAECRKIANDPKNVGWHGNHASHLNRAPDVDGKRTTKAPTLRQLDGDRDEG